MLRRANGVNDDYPTPEFKGRPTDLNVVSHGGMAMDFIIQKLGQPPLKGIFSWRSTT